MGFFSNLFGLGDSKDPEKIEEIAEEVERYADRFDNAEDQENAALARGYAARIRRVATVKEAKALKAEFLAIVGKSSGDNTHERDDADRYSDDS